MKIPFANLTTNLTHKLFKPAARERERVRRGPAIHAFDGCFTFGDIVVPWSEIARIHAGRQERHGWNMIRLEVGADTLAAPLVLTEEQPGFDAFVQMADRKLGFPLGWWDALSEPRHQRSGVNLFERPCHD
jgi:hypothetical protein